MKFTVAMKCPAALDTAIDEAVLQTPRGNNLDEDDLEMLADASCDTIRDQCQKWFEYGECLRVEIDTVAGTCTVLER